jgi:hypothetical protein
MYPHEASRPPFPPQMAVSLGTYNVDCLECKEVEVERTFDSGIKISVLYWRCLLIRVSVIRGSTVYSVFKFKVLCHNFSSVGSPAVPLVKEKLAVQDFEGCQGSVSPTC